MKFARTILFFYIAFLSMPLLVFGQDSFDAQSVQNQLNSEQSKLELIDPIITAGNLSERATLGFRNSLRLIRSDLQAVILLVEPALKSAKVDLADLGPLPEPAEGEEAAPEPENIQKLRAELSDKSLTIEGLLTEAEALIAKSTRLLDKISALRRTIFLNQLFQPQMSPFDVTLWVTAANSFANQIANLPSLMLNGPLASNLLVLISGIVFILMFFAAAKVSAKNLRNSKQDSLKQSQFSKVSSSLLLPAMAVFVGLLLIYLSLVFQGSITSVNGVMIYKALGAGGLLLLAYLSTKRFAHTNIIRGTSHVFLMIITLLFLLDALLLENGRIFNLPLEPAIAQSYVVTTIFALLLGVGSFLTERTRPIENAKYFLPRQVFLVLIAFSGFVLVSNAFGYVALSRYLFEHLFLLFLIVVTILMIRAIIRPYFYKLDALLGEYKDDQEPEYIVFYWLALTLDVVMFLAIIPIIASVMGMEWQDIQDWMIQAFFGFKVGAITISISNIAIAFALFLALLFGTQAIQRVLAKNILPKTKMELSIRQSIVQIIGYVGLVVALMAGVSALGFDLTNLALIAGALSIGIGFGLQSIVSNFVSGLILLFERPIKVGDWIITDSGEGIVKKISVRATEIETFDRTSIIIPNSEFISLPVKNWTHKDKTGRIIISVGVSYSSNPRQVHDLLLEIVERHKDVLKTPAPMIHFKDFADSALIFEVRFFIRNIREVFLISKDVRFEIWDAFEEAGIEISFPQRDLHIRTAPGLEKVFVGKT